MLLFGNVVGFFCNRALLPYDLREFWINAFNWRNGDDVMWNNVIVVAMECEIMSSGNQKAILFKVIKF